MEEIMYLHIDSYRPRNNGFRIDARWKAFTRGII